MLKSLASEVAIKSFSRINFYSLPSIFWLFFPKLKHSWISTPTQWKLFQVKILNIIQLFNKPLVLQCIMYILYILDTVPQYVSSLSPIKKSNRKRVKPTTFFEMDIPMDPTTKVQGACFCKD